MAAAAAAAAVSLLLRAQAARRGEDLRLSLQPVEALVRRPSVALLLLPIRRLAAVRAEPHLVLQHRRLPRSVAAVQAVLVLARKHLASPASVNSSRPLEDLACQQLLASEHLLVPVVGSACSARARRTTCRAEVDIRE